MNEKLLDSNSSQRAILACEDRTLLETLHNKASKNLKTKRKNWYLHKPIHVDKELAQIYQTNSEFIRLARNLKKENPEKFEKVKLGIESLTNVKFKINESDSKFLYVIRSDLGYKIGITNNYKRRLHELNQVIPIQLWFVRIYIKKGQNENNFYKMESNIHLMFNKKNIKGEWFELTQKDIKTIDKVMQQNNYSILLYKDQ